ncbi:MAG: DUF2306 domain-containing protein [Rhizobiales bacterium]|nr:DUF2306 domain-containing protein [Hyphomicrobiales bacterium]
MVALLVLPLAAVAVLTAFGQFELPYELAAVDARLPGLFPLHMASAAAALVLVPTALLLRRRPHLHRTAGRSAAIAVLIAGATAVPVALAGVAPPWAVAGFVAQALAWLGFLSSGYVAIRRGRVQSHARAMLAVTAVTSAAIWLRPAMVFARHADWPFETSYAVIVWASWLVPLAVVAVGVGVVRGRW